MEQWISLEVVSSWGIKSMEFSKQTRINVLINNFVICSVLKTFHDCTRGKRTLSIVFRVFRRHFLIEDCQIISQRVSMTLWLHTNNSTALTRRQRCNAVPLWYVSSSYQAIFERVMVYFVFWRGEVETKYSWWDENVRYVSEPYQKKVRSFKRRGNIYHSLIPIKQIVKMVLAFIVFFHYCECFPLQCA